MDLGLSSVRAHVVLTHTHTTPVHTAPQPNDNQNRAPREDLSGLTAQEKVDRRKARGRVYTQLSQKRRKQSFKRLSEHVERMRVYQSAVEEGPDIVVTLSADVHCRILYANAAIQRILHVDPKAIAGTSFWSLVHTEDRHALAKVLSGIILTRAAQPGPVLPCRVASNHLQAFVDVGMTFKYGTQGVVCVLRPRTPSPAILRGPLAVK